MPRKKSKRKPPRKFRKFLGISLVMLLLLGVAGFVGYRLLPPEGQQNAQETAIRGLSWLREETGPEANRVIDWVIRQIPAARGVLIADPSILGETPHLLAGVPMGQRVRILENEGYLVGYDEDRRNPAWVAYKILVLPKSEAGERPEGFEPDLRTVSRVSPDDYTGSGYDRGHMAPNYGIALSWGPSAQLETFLMSNIVPQNPDLNRGPWREMEARVVDFSRKYGEIWVITGPIWGRERNMLDSGVEIPLGFFKILADLDESDGSLRVVGYVFPQVARGGRSYALKSVDEIERATGLDFFAGLPDEVENEIEERPTLVEWR